MNFTSEESELRTSYREHASPAGVQGWTKRTLEYDGEEVIWQEQDHEHSPIADVAGYARSEEYTDENGNRVVDVETVPEGDRDELAEMVSEASTLGVQEERVNFW